MENVININNTKENTLEFEMVIEGAQTSDVDCNFVIVAKGMELRFPAGLTEDSKRWSVKLPAMDFLERTAYKCYTEVVAEGQYFKPMEGNVNVVGTAQIYTSSPKNKTLESDVKKKKIIKEQEVKRETKRKNTSWRQSEKPIDQIASELLEKEKFSKEKIEEKVEKKRATAKKVDPSKDEKVKAIIKEGIDHDKIKEEVREAVKAVNSKVEKVKKQVAKPVKEAVEKKPEEVKVEETKESSQDTKVKAILEASGIKPKRKKKKVSFVRTKPLH